MSGLPAAIQARLADALLQQARHDLAAAAHDGCAAKLELLLNDVSRARAPAVLCLRLLQALAVGAVHEAANIAYYLEGGFAAAQRQAALDETRDALHGWAPLAALLAPFGDAPLATLAAQARPAEPVVASSPSPGGTPAVVVLSLVNGLGNQIFQYAAALRWARRCGGLVKLDLSLFAHDRIGTRPYALTPFALEAPLADAADLARTAGRPHTEDIGRLDTGLLEGTGDVRLLGCWASPVYFGGVEAEMRRQLAWRDPATGARAAAAVAAARRGSAPVIGLHVRRGDYLAAGHRNSYGAHPAAYYRTALRRFPDDASIILFSDTPADRDWCAEAFADLGPRLTVSRDRADIDDFALLSACDHQILSVSSFGWWAAWLNPNPEKHIVVPHAALGLGPRFAHIQLAGRWPADWTVLAWDDLEAADER